LRNGLTRPEDPEVTGSSPRDGQRILCHHSFFSSQLSLRRK
jgi:hypothetical protein